MNKFKLVIASIGLTGSIFASEIDSFKKGFTIGLEAVEYQLRHEGYEPKIMQLEKPYIVTMDIKETPTNDILYFQHLLSKENINSLITKEFLLIDSFDREPDAIELKSILESKYPINLKVEELTNGNIETYPILFSRTFDNVINHVAQSVDIAYVKKYETPLQIRLEKNLNKEMVKNTKKYRYFKLKNKAMSYTYDYKNDLLNKCEGIKGKCFNSKLFSEYKTIAKDTVLRKGGVYKTDEGEVFQKIYNTNLFIDIEGVSK